MEDMTAQDKIDEIRQWLDSVEHELEGEHISYQSLIELDDIHDNLKPYLEKK